VTWGAIEGRAAEQASKAADFILSFSRTPEDVPEPDGELATI
jgi:hypothetical protein